MEKRVNWGRTISARIEVNNECVENAPYGIKGVASIENGVVTSILDCTIVKEGAVVATFSRYNGAGLNINYNDADATDSVEILQAVNEFINDVKTSKN